MSTVREQVARAAAREVLNEVGISGLPVDPFVIAGHKKPPIVLVERDLPDDIYGACGFIGGQFAIAVSRSCPTAGHRRFTAAHELGHYHLDGHVERMFDRKEGWVASKGAHFQAGADPVEREADYFASELLMAEPFVRPLLRGRPALTQVQRIAKACGTSLTSAAITMATLTHDPVAVLVSKHGVLEWPAFSGAFRDYPWARVRVKGEWAPPRSATKRIARDTELIRNSEQDESDGLLCEWFPDAPDWVEVVEEAIGLGTYGRVLTVLRPGPLPDPDAEQERTWREQREGWGDEDT